MKRTVHFLALLAGVVAASVAHAEPPKSFDVIASARAVPASASLARELGRAGGLVASMDEKRGVPSFLWAVGAHPASTKSSAAAAARSHVVDFARVYGLSPAALGAAEVVNVHDTGRGGIVVVLRQRMAGAELFQSDMKVLMRRNLELVALSGSLDPKATVGIKPGSTPFKITDRHAVAVAFGDLAELAVGDEVLAETTAGQGGYRRFELVATDAMKAAGLRFSTPARAKKIWYRMPSELVAAYFVEVHVGRAGDTSSDYFRYVVAADDGRVLQRQNLTAQDSYDYRVWADGSALHAPLHGPQADFHPHPTGTPDGSDPAFVPPTLVTMDGFNTNPNGQGDPWLPVNATETVGNNVDAYADLVAPDGFSGGDARPVTTSAGVFDYTFDTATEPNASQAQIMAATTQLFYLNNWLHDWWYDSGFDEAAGNAQLDNFGRGGLGDDPLHAEAQDYGGINNANMSTPADGDSPRMQMYLWNGADIVRLVELTPGGTITELGIAQYGPASFDVTAPLVLANDGVGVVTDGCEPFVNNVAGQIVLVDRGACTFVVKTANAEAAGAVGVLIANNVAGGGVMGMSGTLATAIPSVMVSYESGQAAQSELGNGPVTARMAYAPGTMRDGTIDNMISSHEWGHYLHGRLVNGGSQQFGAQGEGWGDFLALHTILAEGDALTGTYAASVYATKTLGDSGYFGIRRFPYSVDFTKNALTFRHISDGEALPAVPTLPNGAPNSEVHQAGEVWASMLFEAYLALIEQTQAPNPPYGFDEARRRMGDYIVAAMMLSPTSPTFTESRDALLAAANAGDPADAVLFAEAFARRGAGSCAVSPVRFSTDLVGVTESFELAPRAELAEVWLDEGTRTCDEDGYLDGDEVGRLLVTVRNGGFAPLTGAELTVTAPLAGVTLPAGGTVQLPDIAPFSTETVAIEVALDDSFTAIEVLDVATTLTAPDACGEVVALLRTDSFSVNVDEAPATIETGEGRAEVWTKWGDMAGEIWSREVVAAPETVWLGVDLGSQTDTALESPDLEVGPTDPFIISFDHSYDFEWDATPMAYDGGVLEISEDGGQSWTDISAYVDPGYTGTLSDCCGNPLENRPAFAGQSASFPTLAPVVLDLGTAFADKTVRVRFRIATDMAVGAQGWLLDNIAFAGITNAPFVALVVDDATCPPPAFCGDGMVNEDEQCDDGDANSDTAPDACRTDCTEPSCGDGVTDTGEQCDDGASNSDTAPNRCRLGCRENRCGDGVVDTGEACDDGAFNADSPDACRSLCTAPACGDGIRDFGEQCDDGNTNEADMCTAACSWGPLAFGDGSGNEGGAPPVAASSPSKYEADGCGCTVPGSGSDRRRAASGLLLALGLALSTRRRKQSS